MNATASNIQQASSMIDAFFGVLLILAIPVLYALFKTQEVMGRKYPKSCQRIKEVPKTVKMVPIVVPEVELAETVVEEMSLLPYDDPIVRMGDHMLDNFRDILVGKVDAPLAKLYQREGDTVRVAGLVAEVRVFKTKKKEPMANAAISDPSGGAEITLYPLTWIATPIDRGDIVLLKGKVKDGQILVNSLEVVGEVPFGRME